VTAVRDPSPAPLELDAVLEPRWLSGALATRFPGVEVASTTITEQITTMATKVRFHVDYVQQSGAPDDLCVKGYFLPPGRDNPTMGVKETRFYQDLAARIPVRLPDCVYGGADPETGHAIIIMEDLVALGCEFTSALSPYTPEQAANSLTQLAAMHAATWGDADLLAYPGGNRPGVDGISAGHGAEQREANWTQALPWLTPNLDMLLSHVSAERLQTLLDGPRGTGLPRSVLDGSRLRAAIVKISTSPVAGSICLVHADAHAGNLFLTPDGDVGIVDWQIVHIGSWGIDVAYHIAAVLDTPTREANEEMLLRSYLDQLRTHGVEPPGWDEAWRCYRVGLAYGLFLWGITIRVDPPIINTFVGRLGAAVAQHGSLDLLGV
jgi:Phosphotransferase enzyme family